MLPLEFKSVVRHLASQLPDDMREKLDAVNAPPATIATADEDTERLRTLSRSPHPYHRLKSDLLELSDVLVYNVGGANARRNSAGATTAFTKEPTPASDSGTEADDEHFLRGLPAPRARLHKGLRGQNEALSGSSTPLLSPAVLEEEGRRAPTPAAQDRLGTKRSRGEKIRRRKELTRRLVEVLLLVCLGGLVYGNRAVQPLITTWRRELTVEFLLFISLLAIYPLRLVIWAYHRRQPSRIIPVSIPSTFDPAPILYPGILPILLSLLVAANVEDVILPNLVLSLSTLPGSLIPTIGSHGPCNPVHWLLTCVPLFMGQGSPADPWPRSWLADTPKDELLVLLFPLHQCLCSILQYLTMTSLLPVELQLLSVGLINILLSSYSPQAEILKALLWVGGLSIIILCSAVIRWAIILARVPKWRFSRSPVATRGLSISRTLRTVLLLFIRPRHDFLPSDFEDSTAESARSSDDDYEYKLPETASPGRFGRRQSMGSPEGIPRPSVDGVDVPFHLQDGRLPPLPRRHTMVSLGRQGPRSKTHTPSGRKKRSASYTVRSFFSLTQAQATARKWMYAGYVYLCILATILVAVREYIKAYALSGNEPIGWALGYLFGDLRWFRFQVVKANLQRWILLPPRIDDSTAACSLGRIEHIRRSLIGEANTRLVLSGYFIAVIVTGLAIVFRLSPVYEVDTRRKVFHFMMVAMFLPATYVDPAFAALGLSIALAIFLLLDLLRASQLPPLSKPIATFLTPYVDGRDLRGPVVVSHIFLLIGCAIPLWLSLAALPRTRRDDALAGWEVPSRDVSMVSGVVCVGLGDAAASLIGRRWGRRKWLWGGGKSLEGSAAFGLAVFGGLTAANAWLRIGGWPVSSGVLDRDAWGTLQGWAATARRTGACATMASLTEAVLTGGNDNVVVPVVLWVCVKSTGI